MKKNMSVILFKQYCTDNGFTRIICDSRNQEWYSEEKACVISMKFDEIMVSTNQNSVCLKSPSQIIQFNHARHISVDEGASVLGTEIDVYCKNDSNNQEIAYKLFAS